MDTAPQRFSIEWHSPSSPFVHLAEQRFAVGPDPLRIVQDLVVGAERAQALAEGDVHVDTQVRDIEVGQGITRLLKREGLPLVSEQEAAHAIRSDPER